MPVSRQVGAPPHCYFNGSKRRSMVKMTPFRRCLSDRPTHVCGLGCGSLPAERFDLSECSRARVSIDYHIDFDSNYYSVPFNLVHELVEVRSTPTTSEIPQRPAQGFTLARTRSRGTPSRLLSTGHAHTKPTWNGRHRGWSTGRKPSVHTPPTCLRRIIADKPHPEMGCRSCLGISRLASVLTVSHGSRGGAGTAYGSMPLSECRVGFENSFDAIPPTAPPPSSHDNIRGAEYFE